MKAVVTKRGAVTIPKKIRDRLGIAPRTVLNFRAEDGRLVATKVLETDPVAAVMGCLKLDKPTDALLDDLRGGA